jgi:hypothetical protein
MVGRIIIMEEDLQYLKLLSFFHYVVGGMAALFAFTPLLCVAIGMLVIGIPAPFDFAGQGLPTFIGWTLIVIGSVLEVLGWIFAFCIILAGRYLARQVHYTFCIVMAALECIFMPFGTVLGVFTVVALASTAVKEMFERTTVSKPTGVRPSG